MTSEKNAAQDEQRRVQQKDERMHPPEGYGGGVKSKTNPAPSTVPSSKQTATAKPIGKGKAGDETDRS